MAPLPLVGNSELVVLSSAGIEAAPTAVEDVRSFSGTDEAVFPRELPTLLSRLDPEEPAEPPWPAALDIVELLPDNGAEVTTADGVTADTGVAIIWPLAVAAPGFIEKPYPGGIP